MIHIGSIIEQELRRQRRSVRWLAEELYLDRSNAYRLLRRQSIDTDMLVRISRVLGRDFFAEYSGEWRRLRGEPSPPADI